MFVEARIPTHIFSISENSLLDICKDNPDLLHEHNRVCSILYNSLHHAAN